MLGYILWTLFITSGFIVALIALIVAVNSATDPHPRHWRTAIATILFLIAFSAAFGAMGYVIHHHDCNQYNDC